MSDKSALVAVNGMDDPKVTETPKKLQHARAHPNPDPYGRSNAANEEPAPNS